MVNFRPAPTHLDDARREQDTASPAQVDIGSKVPSQLDWAHFRGISRREGLEDTPAVSLGPDLGIAFATHQGIPQNTSAMTSMVRLSAKTKRKMKAVRATMETIMTILGPNRSAAHPLTRRPMIPPADDPFDKADCHSAGMT